MLNLSQTKLIAYKTKFNSIWSNIEESRVSKLWIYDVHDKNPGLFTKKSESMNHF
jgi:hypothetical protein